ncbi:E3 ubiquitin-protein ligase [Nymphaea thermarum]|nr:E3 ubiquitin-protein ligase [Nymphaea thermarum]
MEVPPYFKCPISMELMTDPVTACTGVTYDRKSIERWICGCRKSTCPATMQNLENFNFTPNHTLKRLIDSWKQSQGLLQPASSSTQKRVDSKEMADLLRTIESSLFKVSSLKKLRELLESGGDNSELMVQAGGIEVLSGLLCRAWNENGGEDFVAFRSSEESVAILHSLPLEAISSSTIQFLTRPDCLRSLVVMLQTGSSESRFHAVSVLRKITREETNWRQIVRDQGTNLFKALLELLSDGICTEATSSVLEILVDILAVSRYSRVKAVEAGSVGVLIELMPDSSRGRCEKMMVVLKLLCQTADGRSAFVDHAMAVAVVTKKIMTVSELVTKLGVKILGLICEYHPTERFLEQMAELGAVSKLSGVLQLNGGSAANSLRERALKMLKMHGNAWKRHGCFPLQLQDYLRVIDENEKLSRH